VHQERHFYDSGTFFCFGSFALVRIIAPRHQESHMHGLIYLIGLIVVIMFILSLLGLR
jgi:hypothetical protein